MSEVIIFMDSVRLAYLAGVKVGSESLVKGLEKVAKRTEIIFQLNSLNLCHKIQ